MTDFLIVQFLRSFYGFFFVVFFLSSYVSGCQLEVIFLEIWKKENVCWRLFLNHKKQVSKEKQ